MGKKKISLQTVTGGGQEEPVTETVVEEEPVTETVTEVVVEEEEEEEKENIEPPKKQQRKYIQTDARKASLQKANESRRRKFLEKKLHSADQDQEEYDKLLESKIAAIMDKKAKNLESVPLNKPRAPRKTKTPAPAVKKHKLPVTKVKTQDNSESSDDEVEPQHYEDSNRGKQREQQSRADESQRLIAHYRKLIFGFN